MSELQTARLAFELGYKACEDGKNIQLALSEFDALMRQTTPTAWLKLHPQAGRDLDADVIYLNHPEDTEPTALVFDVCPECKGSPITAAGMCETCQGVGSVAVARL